MIEDILDPENWQLLPIEEQLKMAKENSERPDDEKPDYKIQHWENSSQALSQLSIYKYLKARFGPPNGFVMFLKNTSSDNLIHWQYAISAPKAFINFWGKTSGLEISVKSLDKLNLEEADWQLLISNLQASMKKHSTAMKRVQEEFEHWSLFINPFARVEHTLQDYIRQLERLKLDEPQRKLRSEKKDIDAYQKKLQHWIKNIDKAASIGTTVRMLCPVMAESFVNLILLIFRKEEYAEDERLYDSLLRQQIDVRVKTLHIHCTCFPKQVDSKSSAFKNFHSLMNRRNDFLHGNIDPKKLIVEDVWFDQRFIPLFEKDEGVIKKMMRNYCTNVEPDKAIGDFQVVSDFIALLLMAMDDGSFQLFLQILADRMPGINNKTKRLGVLFPSQYLAENWAGR